MIQDKDQLIDIYDIWYQPFYRQAWFYNILIILALALLGALLYFIYTKYVKKTKLVDCSVIAYQQLDSLKNFQIVSKQDSKDCYFKVSLIIKTYLACRYHAIFLRLTDKEIVQHAQDYMSDSDIRLLHRLFQGMTFLKFEHEVAAHDKLEKDIQLIKEFIENTSQLDDTKEA
ncbi:hypothetical protein KBC04_01770 [Candidatus Babeliales bacterium]|nr:hypothetical protein [Candidatus Babeliales bacterium]MBP9843551.1 hypothetical protein [Candidatus Babeliales bacterium]